MVNGGLFADMHTHPWRGTPLLRTPLGALGMRRAQRSPRVFGTAMTQARMYSRGYRPAPEELAEMWSAVTRRDGAAFLHNAAGFVGEHRRHAQRWDLAAIARDLDGTVALYVGGSDEDPYEHRQIPATRERVPQAEVLTFPGGHLTTSEHPDLLAAAIRDIAVRHGVGTPAPPSSDNPSKRNGTTMTRMNPLLERNEQFARTYTPVPLGLPAAQMLVVTCLDHRVDPAIVLGLQLGDAPVIRNAGGRVTQAVIDDIAYLAFLAEQLFGRQGPADTLFEVAVIHHTQCGTGFLADPDFRRRAAEATGVSEAALDASAVADPHLTVKADVERLLASPLLSPKVSVSGHVYDIATGRVTTTLDARYP